MSSGVYFDTYKQYKAGTSKLVTWLAETAKACGASGLDPKPNSGKTKLTLPVNELVRLAKTIVNSETPKIKVSESIIGVLEEVIAARKRCATWFHNQPAVPTSDVSNHGHKHFIEILEQVLQILSPSSGVPRAKRGPGKRNEGGQSGDNTSKDNDTEVLSNVFEYLTVEEPTVQSVADEHPLPDGKTKRKDKSPQVVYEVETSEYDAMFALFCWFIDCINVRKFLREMWLEWRFGQCSLTTAALVTNIAFNIVRRMHLDLTEAFPRFSTQDGIYSFLNMYFLNQGSRRSHYQSGEPSKADKEDSQLVDAYSIRIPLGDLGLAVYHSLAHFFGREREGKCSLRQNFLNPDLSRIPNRGSDYKSGLLERSVADGLTFMSMFEGKYDLADEFTRGLWTVYKERQIPPWLVVAGEIIVDLHYSLREDIRRGFEDTKATADHALQNLRDYFRHSRSITVDRAFQRTEEYLAQLPVFVMKIIRTDHIAKLRKMDGIDYPAFYLFEHHPVLCGSLKFQMESILHHGGVKLANEWQVIFATVHLYNVLRQCGHLDITWPDIEEVISTQTARHLFVGDIPTSPEECFNRYWLASGISATAFARNVRSGTNRNAQSVKRRRMLDNCTPILDIFLHQFQREESQDATLCNIETVLATSINAGSDKETVQARRNVSTQQNRSNKLSPIQLLKALADEIDKENFRLHFDYISLNKRCIELLKQLRTTIQEEYDRFPWPEETQGDINVANVVNMVFQVASTTDDRIATRRSVFLDTVGSVIRGIIEKKGDVEVHKARALNGRREDKRDRVEVLRAEEFHDLF